MKQTLFVCGEFGFIRKKPESGFFKHFANALKQHQYKKIVNGGTFADLIQLLQEVKDYSRIFWMPKMIGTPSVNFLSEIKELNPDALLFTFKYNLNQNYSLWDLIGFEDSQISDFILEISKEEENEYFRLFDQKGNIFLNYTKEFSELVEKISFLSNLFFYKSPKITMESLSSGVENIPSRTTFFGRIQKHGKTVGDLFESRKSEEEHIPDPFLQTKLGVASFLGKDNIIYISQPNISDKIEQEDYIPVILELPVWYYGKRKPSKNVITHIQLYSQFNDIKYIYQSPAYIKDALLLDYCVPYSQEIAEKIVESSSDDKTKIRINFQGIGSFVLSDNLKYIEATEYYLPEKPDLIEL